MQILQITVIILLLKTDDERDKGLPLSMEVFDRETCNVPLTQCGFVDMFAREMFRYNIN